jgi:hypothetical protein
VSEHRRLAQADRQPNSSRLKPGGTGAAGVDSVALTHPLPPELHRPHDRNRQMQLLRIASCTLLATAVVLMPGGTNNSASCRAAESWEQHVVITPVSLVAASEVRDSHAKTNKLDSLTGLSEPMSAAVPASPFPLSCPVFVGFSEWDTYDPRAPILLKVLFGKADTHAVATTLSDVPNEWYNAWDRPPDGTEWSPLKLTFPVVVDRAAPEQLVSRATIEEEEDWHRFRFILPHTVRSTSWNSDDAVRFELDAAFPPSTNSWLDALRVYTFAVKANRSVERFRVPYDIIDVDATEIDCDFLEKPGHFRELLIDRWLGTDEPKPDATRVFRFGGIEIGR